MSATKRRKERLKTLNAWQEKAKDAKKARLSAWREFIRLDALEKERAAALRARLKAIEDARLEAESLAKDRPASAAGIEAW